MSASFRFAATLAIVCLLAGCQNRAAAVTQQLLGTWSVVGEDDFNVTTAGERYTFEDDGTLSIREQRGFGASGTLRAAYEVGRDGSLTLRERGNASTFSTAFAGDTLRLTPTAQGGSTLTLTRLSGNP
ncbi:MAG: hypothetical protein AAGG50_02195 [Bacteroidota bacterium]